ncbi:MAG TPA: hypothetical protein VG675_02550 [Bryobacteraceae bacterium]|nr:hypothetical protein [Bryobacteraceae bacterium]
MKRLLFVGILVSAILQPQTRRQQAKLRTLAVPTATVRVVAYEANGRYLGAPDVSLFVEVGDHENLASKFHNGVAEGVLYSVYRIEGRQQGYYSDAKYVRVYQPSVTVVLVLRFADEWTPSVLAGRVVGLQGSANKAFAKLVGVYENISIDSEIGSDGSFTLGGLSPGAFLLFVVDDHGILASRELTIPYTGPPLEIQIKRSQPLPRK